MSLQLSTYDPKLGGHSLFKALGHPLAARQARPMLEALEAGPPVVIYDPLGQLDTFAALYDLSRIEIQAVLTNRVERLGTKVLGLYRQAISELVGLAPKRLLVSAFDARRELDQCRHLLPEDCEIFSLDTLKLPGTMLSRPENYLDPLNFATNYAFFRDEPNAHTRLVTANYWAARGAVNPTFWCCLFSADGDMLVEWDEPLPPANGVLVLDSQAIRARFDLPPFVGSLFIHAIDISGHDVVKYVLDTYGDEPTVLSATHDANAWPAEWYAGLPAPADGEKVILWVQNSHPVAIPAGAVRIGVMGEDDSVQGYDDVIPPFATRAIDVNELCPGVAWPQQLEIQAGKHFVRPRYEIVNAHGRRRIAHANVERDNLPPNPELATLARHHGKGYIVPGALFPLARFRTELLPTPMERSESVMPVKLLVYDDAGRQVLEHKLGRLPRNHATCLDLDRLVSAADLGHGYGHMELVYDFTEGNEANGWLHAFFRYTDRASGHVAETIFGAHVFNTLMVYRDEPQSYAGRPPGLSTRLFLRLGLEGQKAYCHLIYPASLPHHAASTTDLILHDAQGNELARKRVRIAQCGSLFWEAGEMFGADRVKAGDHGYVLVRDTTCRLFGYQALANEGAAFALDHMFGF